MANQNLVIFQARRPSLVESHWREYLLRNHIKFKIPTGSIFEGLAPQLWPSFYLVGSNLWVLTVQRVSEPLVALTGIGSVNLWFIPNDRMERLSVTYPGIERIVSEPLSVVFRPTASQKRVRSFVDSVGAL